MTGEAEKNKLDKWQQNIDEDILTALKIGTEKLGCFDMTTLTSRGLYDSNSVKISTF